MNSVCKKRWGIVTAAWIIILVAHTAWSSESVGFRIGTADSLQKIKRDYTGLSNVEFKDTVFLDSARDEAESFQIVIIADRGDVHGAQIKFNGFTPASSNIQFKCSKVGYSKTGNPSYPVEYTGWWPDPLLPLKSVDVASGTLQPIWISFVTSPATQPGVYRGTILVAAGETSREIAVVLNVRSFMLPRPGTLAAPFGMYKKVLDEWYFGPGGSMPIEAYDRWAEFLAQYRLTPKELGNDYVKTTYSTNAAGVRELTEVDMSALNPRVKEMTAKYFPPYTYGIYRLPSQPTIKKALENNAGWATPEKIAEPVRKYLDEWRNQGLTEQAFIYGIDEPSGEKVFELTAATYRLIREIAPSFKIMQTGNVNNPRLIGLVDIWVPKSVIAWEPFFQDRLKAGDILWQYVCLSPTAPYPNFFVDEPAIDHRILFWQTRKIGATGFLFWTVIWHNGITPKAFGGKPAFPDVPWDFSKAQYYTDEWCNNNGDGMLVYPGHDLKPLSSVRLEVIRDGIEDYEYFGVLKKLTDEVAALPAYQTPGTKDLILKARELFTVPDSITSGPKDFTKNPELLRTRRKEMADMIEQLQDILTNKPYETWKWWKKKGAME